MVSDENLQCGRKVATKHRLHLPGLCNMKVRVSMGTESCDLIV
jgi:hypothetical protein